MKAKVDKIPIFGQLQKQEQPSTFDNPNILGEYFDKTIKQKHMQL